MYLFHCPLLSETSLESLSSKTVLNKNVVESLSHKTQKNSIKKQLHEYKGWNEIAYII